MAVTKEAVAKLYVATFDRAPDAAGLKYWVEDSGLTINQIAESFFAQDETKEKYPDTLSDAKFVETIYNNLFNRDADPDGLVYWTNELDSGNISRADMIMAIVNGAQGDDAKILDNKTEVGIYFADQGLNDHDKAVDIMENITADSATVNNAKSIVDGWVDTSAEFTMTKNADNFEGTDGDDSFFGVASSVASDNTFQAIDKLDGKGGNDTLKLQLASGIVTTAATKVKNIETLQIDNQSTSATTVDVTNFDDKLEDIILKGSGANAVTVGTPAKAGANLNSILDNVTLSSTNTKGTLKVIYEDSVVAGTNDSSEITLTNGVNQTFTSDSNTTGLQGIEQYTVHTGSGVENLNLTDSKLKKVIIDGAADLTLSENATAANTTTIDASAATGNITYNQNAADTGATTIIGGSGNDTLTLGKAVNSDSSIDGGAGSDNISIAAGNGNQMNLTLKGGLGNDTIDASGMTKNTSNVTINGGDGKDTMTASTGIDKFFFADSGDTGLTTSDMDIVKSFKTSGADKIDFDNLAAGNGTGVYYNDTGAYKTGAIPGASDSFVNLETSTTTTIASFNDMLTAANNVFNDTDHNFTYAWATDGTNGYLFVDSDHQNGADEAIELAGLTKITKLVATDIIA